MDLATQFGKDLATAFQRMTVKRTCATELAKLSAADRKGVLMELLAEDGDVVRSAGAPNGKAAPPVVPPSDSGSAFGGGPGTTAKVLAIVGAEPGIKSIEVTKKIFGVSDSKSQSRVRSVLFTLKNQDRVRSVGKGCWEVVEQED